MRPHSTFAFNPISCFPISELLQNYKQVFQKLSGVEKELKEHIENENKSDLLTKKLELQDAEKSLEEVEIELGTS